MTTLKKLGIENPTTLADYIKKRAIESAEQQLKSISAKPPYDPFTSLNINKSITGINKYLE